MKRGLFNPAVVETHGARIPVELWNDARREASKRLIPTDEFISQALKYALAHLPERFNDEEDDTGTIALPGDLDSDSVFKDYDEALEEYNAVINAARNKAKKNAIKS